MKHILHSCTKSITSALIGIAIDQGYIKGVDEQVFEFFPENRFAHMDERKRAITIKHLLTMSHGIRNQDNFVYKWQGLLEMRSSKDWVRFILDQPMDIMPGTRFDYSNGSSFLLSAILSFASSIHNNPNIFLKTLILSCGAISNILSESCIKKFVDKNTSLG